MFSPHAMASARPEGPGRSARTPLASILAAAALALFLLLPAARAGSPPWNREAGASKVKTLPPIPKAREAVRETPSPNAAPANLSSRPVPVVAMLDFNSTTLSVGEEDAFSQALWAEFYQSPATRVLPRREMRWWLIAWDLHPLQPVGRRVSVGRAARALKADYLVHGHLNLTDGAAMLDYQVYSTRLGGVVMKNTDVRTASLRDMALLIPDIARSILTGIEVAEQQTGPSMTSAAASGTQLLAEPEMSSLRKETPDEPGPSSPAVRPARNSRAAEAAAERERARRLEEAHREAVARAADSAAESEIEAPAGTGTAPIEAPASPEASTRVVAESTGASDETAAKGDQHSSPAASAKHGTAPTRPRPTELAMVSPTNELAPVEPPKQATPSRSRVDLQPVSRGTGEPEPESEPESESAPEQPEPRAAPSPAEAAPDSPPAVETPMPEPSIDLTSKEAARKAYEKSRALPPEDTAARIGLLEQAVVLDPTEIDYAKSLALTYYKAARYNDCIEASRKAAALAPEDSIVLTILGSALFETGRFEEARATHVRALDLDPSNLYSRFNLALTLQALGSPRALAAWSEYLELSEGVAAQADNRRRALQYYDDLKAATR